jgi:hypothetical protein
MELESIQRRQGQKKRLQLQWLHIFTGQLVILLTVEEVG